MVEEPAALSSDASPAESAPDAATATDEPTIQAGACQLRQSAPHAERSLRPRLPACQLASLPARLQARLQVRLQARLQARPHLFFGLAGSTGLVQVSGVMSDKVRDAPCDTRPRLKQRFGHSALR